MSIPSILPIVASLATAVKTLYRKWFRARANARTVRYLHGMPDYLRRDIGLTEHADIAQAVDRGLARDRQAAGEARRHGRAADGISTATALIRRAMLPLSSHR
ncbi:MAG: DUF1127 domain-containing protein [Rhizobiaceae bacterium]|nr:DUF1127 domain-containing protein [Rhizobiaceae bacterium]